MEVGDDLALKIDDDDVVMLFGPIEAGEVSEFLIGIHTLRRLGSNAA